MIGVLKTGVQACRDRILFQREAKNSRTHGERRYAMRDKNQTSTCSACSSYTLLQPTRQDQRALLVWRKRRILVVLRKERLGQYGRRESWLVIVRKDTTSVVGNYKKDRFSIMGILQ